MHHTMLMIESTMAVRFAGAACFNSASAAIPSCRATWISDDFSGVHVTLRRVTHSGSLDVCWNRFSRLSDGSFTKRKSLVKNRVRASAEQSGPIERNEKSRYHPCEDIVESTSQASGDARLTAAETLRTVVEVNSKATLMFSDLISDEVHENIIWPELPYVTDEHGNIYFQVNNDEDILRTLTSENNFVQVIIGFDTMEMLSELDQSDIDFGIEEIEDEDSDEDDDDDDDDDDDEEDEDEDYAEDWVAILDDEEDSDGSLGDWAKLETMRSSHPMYFAKKLTEVASDDPVDWMDQPPAGLAIQGVIRPAFIEEQSVIQKQISDQASIADVIKVGKIEDDKVEVVGIINGSGQESGSSKDSSIWAEESDKNETEILKNGTSYYKLEMIKIQLVSAHGNETVVELEDYIKAQPDAIAHSATKIMLRLKAGGENTTQALKSLCWRCKGIHVDEATIIGVDTLGFDVRVCSGTQVQTLRFSFNSRATSEYSAERQLNDVLFPRIQQKVQVKKEAHQKEL